MTVSTCELSVQDVDLLPAREAPQSADADLDLTNYATAESGDYSGAFTCPSTAASSSTTLGCPLISRPSGRGREGGQWGPAASG
jgi:hypothetical protein